MNDIKLIYSLVIGVIILFGLFMLLTNDDEEPVPVIVNNETLPEPRPSPPRPAPLAETLEPEVVETPVISEAAENNPEPIVSEPVVAEPALPALNDSDAFVQEELAAMANGAPLINYLVSEELIRKFVVMVENMSRGEFPERNRPLLNPAEPMQITELGSEFFLMDTQSYQRFSALITALSNISTDTTIEVYRRFLPLFQQAFAELGLRNSDFTEVTLLAIDNVLNARTAAQPQQLIRPTLNYLYANPEIENYTDVEKLLMRLGPQNTENLQRRLEFIKRRLEMDASLSN